MLTTRSLPSFPMPLIETFRPQFLVTEKATPDEQVNIALKEAKEVIWLHAIQNLTKESLGIHDDVALAKFQALMILQAHQLFFLRQSWEKQYADLIKSISISIYSEWSVKLIKKIFSMLSSLDGITDKVQVEKTIKGLLQPDTTQMKKQYLELGQLEDKLFLPADRVLAQSEAKDKEADALEKYFVDWLRDTHIAFEEKGLSISTMGTFDTDCLQRQVNEAQAQWTFQTTVTEGAKRFNAETIKQIQALKNQDADQIISASSFNKYKRQLIKYRKEYIDFNDQYLALFEDSVQNIQRFIPNFTTDIFSKCYQIAFEIFTRPENTELFGLNYLYEIYLQEGRMPQRQTELHDLLVESYLPRYQKFFPNANLTLSKLAGLIDVYLPRSLHQVIAEAYSILHAPSNSLEQNPTLLLSWSNQKPAQPVLALIPAQNSTQLILRLTSNPLFDEKHEVPGTILSSTQAILKVKGQLCDFYKRELFAGFSTAYTHDRKKSSKEQKFDDRTESVNRFNDTLKELTTVEEIAALVAAAKPHVNRHRHDIYDAITKKQNVNTWLRAFDNARNKALGIIKQEATANPFAAEDLVKKWRDQPLFADKYALSKLSRAKNAQDKLDEILKNLQQRMKKSR